MGASVAHRSRAEARARNLDGAGSGREEDPLPIHDGASHDRFLGALLAGGASRRMGVPKERVELGGHPLAAWAARALATAARPTVQIGGRPIPGLDWPTWPDVFPDAGPAGGIATALGGAGGGPVLVLAVDLPFVTPGLLRTAGAAVAAGAAAAVPRWEGRWHPLAGAWSPAALRPLGDRLRRGRRDLQSLLDELRPHAVEGSELEGHGDPGRLLLNVNTPEDLRHARALLDADAPGRPDA